MSGAEPEFDIGVAVVIVLMLVVAGSADRLIKWAERRSGKRAGRTPASGGEPHTAGELPQALRPPPMQGLPAWRRLLPGRTSRAADVSERDRKAAARARSTDDLPAEWLNWDLAFRAKHEARREREDW